MGYTYGIIGHSRPHSFTLKLIDCVTRATLSPMSRNAIPHAHESPLRTLYGLFTAHATRIGSDWVSVTAVVAMIYDRTRNTAGGPQRLRIDPDPGGGEGPHTYLPLVSVVTKNGLLGSWVAKVELRASGC
jgi:hypothetical protein